MVTDVGIHAPIEQGRTSAASDGSPSVYCLRKRRSRWLCHLRKKEESGAWVLARAVDRGENILITTPDGHYSRLWQVAIITLRL